MSVFEDLIDELKNENLLEDTVIDLKRADAAVHETAASGSDEDPSTGHAFVMPVEDDEAHGLNAAELNDVPQIEMPSSETEFFRKRAMDELSSLQMVEHVLSGIERDQLKITPVSFDDLNAKKALHRFMQVSADPRSVEHAEAELALRQETEAWSYAHFERDQKISVAHLRRFCEECRPVLSSQALVALARFYRNSPYSEDVRGKFEYVMTRLFSREAGDGSRRLLFEPREMTGHITTLYANWSSIALYTRDDDRIEVSLTVTRLGEFRDEVENAVSFDELLNSGFFDRIRAYKEECSEMFYVPDVVTEAIKCNLAVGNRYIELVAHERQENGVKNVEEKYGSAYDALVSAVAGKTLVLSDVLALEPSDHGGENGEDAAGGPAQPSPSVPKTSVARGKATVSERFDLFGVNRWLLIACIACIVFSVGVYIWAEKFAGGNESAASVATPVEIEDPDIKKYLRTPRATKETLYAVTEPTYDMLSEAEQKELLGKVRKIANSKNLNKVALLNNSGKTIAFASKDRLELINQ
jgi:hypothetical protein